MGNDPNREHEFDDELAAYALGALDEAERPELERHLVDCERCRERLSWLEPAIGVLPASVEQVRPPARLKRRVMAAVREDARAQAGESRSWWGRRLSLRARPALALAAGGLLAAGAIGFGLSIALNSDDNGTASDAIVAQSSIPGATGSVEPEGSGIGLHVADLPALPRGSVYQLWLKVGGELMPSRTFRLASDLTGYAWIAKLPEGAEEILVTREPRGGSDAPTSPVVMQAPLRS